MASCPKCGKARVIKRPSGTRACKRCGVLLGALGFLRNGSLGAYPLTGLGGHADAVLMALDGKL